MDDMGARLSKLRRDKGLNQEELAEKLGVSRQAVSKWERSESTPDISNLIALSELYDVSIDYLAKGRGAEALQAESIGEESIEDADVHESARLDGEEASSEATSRVAPDEWAAPSPDSAVYVGQDASNVRPNAEPINYAEKRSSPWTTFPYPVVIALLYLFIGFVFNGWHPWWMLFLTIPVYYWIARVIVHDPEYIKDHPQYKTSKR